MADEFPEDLRRKLTQYGQDHILRRWSDLTPAVRNRLLDQLRVLDLARLAALVETRRQKGNGPDNSLVERARRAVPPSSIVRLPKTADERARWKEAHQAGEELLRAGKVGAILVAGGQGTRLGFDKPKGMFPTGPVSGAPLFQILAEQVLARSRRGGQPIPYFIMTSDATHDRDGRFLRRA